MIFKPFLKRIKGVNEVDQDKQRFYKRKLLGHILRYVKEIKLNGT